MSGPAPYSERTLREFFFPPFEKIIERTGVSAVMPSYNEIDGVPSTANVWLLQKVLRGEWGFKGAVVSDYYAIEDLQRLHHIAATPEEAARLALEAGVDIDLPSPGAYATLTQQVRDGTRADVEHRRRGAPLAHAEISRRLVRASLRRCRAGRRRSRIMQTRARWP